jgi:hypothetical protein
MHFEEPNLRCYPKLIFLEINQTDRRKTPPDRGGVAALITADKDLIFSALAGC